MKNNLNEEISRIKKLLNINENTLILEANPILALVKKLVPSLEGKFVTSIETKLGKKMANASEAEIKTAFKSAEMAVIRREIADAIYAAEKNTIDAIFDKYNMSAAGESASAYSELSALRNGEFAGITKDLGKSYRAGKGSTGTGAGAGAGGKQAVTFGGGKGLASLPLKASVDDVMKHIDVDPIFSGIMKTKKGSRELVEKWIETNIGDNVTPEAILGKVETYFERLAQSPDVKTVTFSKRIDQVIGIAKKGGEAWEGSKGSLKWGLTIALLGIVVGVWTLKDVLSSILCRLGWTKTNDWFGCTSGGGNTNNSGTGQAQKGELN